MKVPAMIKDPRRLSTASDCKANIDAWEPVKMTGFPKCESMKDSAELVYAIEAKSAASMQCFESSKIPKLSVP